MKKVSKRKGAADMGELRILHGGAKTGKSSRIYEEIRMRRPGKSILLVPEQHSHASARALCAVCGAEGALYAEAMSFTDLCRRVFETCGGTAVRFLDDSGRLLLMNRCLEKLRGTLEVYAGVSAKPGVLRGLIDTVDELKSCGVTAEQLTLLSGSVDFGPKLRELALILETWDELSADVGLSPADRLTLAAGKLEKSDFGRDLAFFVDGFTDFTYRELEILGLLLPRCAEMTVVLTLEDLPASEAFRVPRETLGRLTALAARLGVSCRTECMERTEPGDALASLRTRAMDRGGAPIPGGTEQIGLAACDTAYDECLWAAERISALVRAGARYGEIAVAVRQPENYRDLLESAFALYDIPLFLSGSRAVQENPVHTLISAALDAVIGGFQYEDVFRCLKTGLAGLDWEDCDKLENYVLKWSIRGDLWWREADWSFHPGGYGLEFDDEARQTLRELNDLRQRVRRPFAALREALSAHTAARDRLEAVYDFLLAIRLPDNLLSRAERLRELGELRRASDYEKLWDALMAALDQCAAILGDAEIGKEAFCDLLAGVLASESVDAIPLSVDRVLLTELSRTGNTNPAHLLILGANDGVIPMATENAGVITEQEREVLLDLGLGLQPGAETLLTRELYAAYSALAAPEKTLDIAWARSDEEGAELRPSAVAERVMALFPEVSVRRYGGENGPMSPRAALGRGARELSEGGGSALLDALEAMPDMEDRVRRVRAAAGYERGHLGPGGVRDLYGGTYRMSASKIDKFHACRFSYFMQYGLRAKPRKSAGFEAPEMGTFVHEILEKTARDAEAAGGFAALTAEEVRALAKTHVEDYVHRVLDDFRDKTPRFQYLFRRLLKNVYAVVDDMAEELRASRFRPLAFELAFGGPEGALPPVAKAYQDGELRITGFVDRVDGWEKDGKLYLRVVDYKTGQKKFDLTDVSNGLGLQMLIYLFALAENGTGRFGEHVQPAGVLYVPAREVTVQAARDADREAVRREAAKKLRRSGLVLDDPEVVAAMEDFSGGQPRFLPVAVNKNGDLTGEALVSAERLGRLSRHIDEILREMTRALSAGEIEAQPFRRSQKSPCDYCEFKAACLYDEESGTDMPRDIQTVDADEFWLRLEGEEARHA